MTNDPVGIDIPEEARAQKTCLGYSKKAVSTIIDIFSGSVGGMCGLLVNSPFDLVKVTVKMTTHLTRCRSEYSKAS